MNFENRNKRSGLGLRSVYDYTMGILWISVGVFFLFQKKFGYDLQLDSVLTVIFGISSLLYGAFRIYRGIKQTNN